MELKATSNYPFENEFDELIRAFAPRATVGTESNIYIEFIKDSYNYTVKLMANGYEKLENITIDNKIQPVKQKAQLRKLAKIMLYDYISRAVHAELPYGSLTGIRPTKLYHEALSRGLDVKEYFTKTLRVNGEVVDFLGEIVANQEKIYSNCSDEIDLFVNIPICVSRCSYCSFIAAEYGKIKKWIAPYVSSVTREIAHAKEIIRDGGYKLRAIYVGGGTPTSLSEDEFAEVMRALSGLEPIEFTVEAGRPDTINKAKLDIMKAVNVTRISINPQTFNDTTLEKIGRSHNSQDILTAYELAREYPFDINMDLIAMLPGESFEMFQKSALKAIELRPENITVHTLSIKKGSDLKLTNYDNQKSELATQMVNYSKKVLTNNGYKPYYMYKQKYMSGNLENTGYALPNKACVYNIDIMEETHSIIACGAGGISKRRFIEEDRLERLANAKGIDVYLERLDDLIIEKAEFFKRSKV